MHAAIAAADAGVCVRRSIQVIDDAIRDAEMWHVVAAGKAATPMLRACLDGVARPPATAMAVSPGGLDALPAWVVKFRGGHPTPNEASVAAGTCALRTAEAAGARETVVVLLSGGASALLALPANAVSLEDKQAATDQLLRAGADIRAINTVRKHLSMIKGGRLAAATRGRLLCLAISDVVGDDLSAIGSGPTVGDPTTYADALAVIDRSGGPDRFPQAVMAALREGSTGDRPETPKPNSGAFSRADTRIIGSRRDAMEGASARARELGYRTLVIGEPVVGDARTVSTVYAAALFDHARLSGPPLCLVSSGETTVEVSGSGKGGRNQEFALALAKPLAAAVAPIVVASAGTDGIDGPTDAAGAVVTPATQSRAIALGMDPRAFLANNDAYSFFSRLEDLIFTGPTSTNVGDIQIALIAAPRG